ncbi:MAG: GIY-YIG nuclease family protein [Patescibacteria group bacterium]
MYHVYILKLKDNSYYVGSSGNLEQRLFSHERGRVRSTKNKLPFRLIHKESYDGRSEAQTREYQIKGWKSRAAIERLIKKE